jgi:hypothetical protein
MWKGIAMRIPAFVISQVDLHQVHSCFNKSPSHQQRPTKRILAISLLLCRRSTRDIQGAVYMRVCEQRNRILAIRIK